jgi:hypothetical protein
MGKFNKNFVINEFNLFIHKLNYRSVMNHLLFPTEFTIY